MKKLVKLIVSLSLTAAAVPAFAGTDAGSVLNDVISRTDAQIAPALGAALELAPSFAVPAPAAMPERAARGISIVDITAKCTENGTVVSAFPGIYKKFASEENSRIIRVFLIADPQRGERRLEVYFTGGDWMEYGLTYFVTNAGEAQDQIKVYPVSDLSTPDAENGAVAPKVDPFDVPKLKAFVLKTFMDAGGNVRPGFSSIAATKLMN